MQRIYFDFNNGNYSRFAGFQSSDSNQVHIQLFGENMKAAKIVSRWDDREFLAENDIKSLRFDWTKLYDPHIPQYLAYISFHPVELCFRLQLAGAQPKDIKIEHEIDKYIDFIIMSDLSKKYTVMTKTIKHPSELLAAKENTIWLLRGSISVNDFDLREHPFLGKDVSEAHPDIPVRLFTTIQEKQLTQNIIDSKPEGTIVTFLFHQKDGRYSSKGIVVR